MNALQLAQRLETLGTTLDTGADWDSAIVQLTSLTSRVADAFTVLAEVLRYPAFPESELSRLRAERLADLAQLRAEPRGLADVYFSRLLYVPESRFAGPVKIIWSALVRKIVPQLVTLPLIVPVPVSVALVWMSRPLAKVCPFAAIPLM